MKDTYILRLCNTVYGNEAPRLSANKDQWFIRIPNFLRDKGKCRVSVIDMNIQLKNGSGTSVVPANTHLIGIRSNIPMLGFNNENNGLPNILGMGKVSATGNAVSTDSSQALSFTCGKLPDEVHLERVCLDPANDFNLIAADNFTTNVVPFQVDLELQFFEDDH